jgi:hypothetical protein
MRQIQLLNEYSLPWFSKGLPFDSFLTEDVLDGALFHWQEHDYNAALMSLLSWTLQMPQKSMIFCQKVQAKNTDFLTLLLKTKKFTVSLVNSQISPGDHPQN